MASTTERGDHTNASDSNMSLKLVLSAASPLSLRIIAECPVTKARACDLILPHTTVSTPVFMPVGTQGTLKGITVDQLEDLGCQICLGNTYHLGMRPVKYRFLLLLTLLNSFYVVLRIKNKSVIPYEQGPDLIEKASGLHGFMNWKKNLLTVSAKLLLLTVQNSLLCVCVQYIFVYRHILKW